MSLNKLPSEPSVALLFSMIFACLLYDESLFSSTDGGRAVTPQLSLDHSRWPDREDAARRGGVLPQEQVLQKVRQVRDERRGKEDEHTRRTISDVLSHRHRRRRTRRQ